MSSPSSLLLEERYEAADERFVDEVLASSAAKRLHGLAARWFGEATAGDAAARKAFARRALLRYIDDGCDRPGHRPLVKALFKLAERAGDDELMGHLLVAFDRLVRRRLTTAYRLDSATGAWSDVPALAFERGIPRSLGSREAKAPRFSRRTRQYLVRRALRYFRTIARTDETRYGQAIRSALALYEDQHLAKPEQLLDAWGLVHALYWGSPALVRDPRGVRLAEGRSLAELAPAPFAPDAWQGALHGVLDLAVNARSRPVRGFALALLERDYAEALRGMPLARVRGLLRSPHEEVQAFAARVLTATRGAAALTVDEWLELLRIDNPLALPLLCELCVKVVSPGRLSLAQCVSLACEKAAPVAELGLAWAQAKPVDDDAALEVALGLARASVPGVRTAATAWLAAKLAAAPFATPVHVRELLDASAREPRRAALTLAAEHLRFGESPALWTAMAESPHADVRAFLVAHLRERQSSFEPGSLRAVWATTLLAVHRGGRAKRGALMQVADRAARTPAEAESLVPLLGVALRSVRAPERRAALAAIARAAMIEPRLRAAIARLLPELSLSGEVAA
jgi:hypothetical protein